MFVILVAERILVSPKQLLVDNEPTSAIRVGLLGSRICRQVRITTDYPLNEQTVRKFFTKQFGEVESCKKIKYDGAWTVSNGYLILTFSDSKRKSYIVSIYNWQW